MTEKSNTSKYERLVENLQLLETRNPDLTRFLNLLDVWLNSFVQSGSEVSSVPVNESETIQEKESVSSASAKQPETVITRSNSSKIEVFAQEPVPPVTLSTPSSKENETPKVSVAASVEKAPIVSYAQTSTTSEISQGPAAESLTSDIDPMDISRQSVNFQNGGLWRNEDIDQLEKRLLLKIEATRWALERDRLLKTAVNFQTEIEPKDHNLLSRARELTNCYLWMNNPETAPAIATETYEMLADAYYAAATCVGFMRELIELMNRSPKSEILSRILRDALYITATAQSALRRVTYDVSGREDQDQIRIHRWLTLLTKRYGIYVNRHMKKDSLAPKDRIYVIPDYIARLRKEVEKLGQRQKILTEGFRRIQYHAARIQNQNGSDYDWNKIIETVDELVDAGIPANDERFDSALRPILVKLKNVPPYKEHPFFINVLMELDFWHENEVQKARVAYELSAMPPQPKAASEPSAEEYTSIWDEMEYSASADNAQAETEVSSSSSASITAKETPVTENFSSQTPVTASVLPQNVTGNSDSSTLPFQPQASGSVPVLRPRSTGISSQETNTVPVSSPVAHETTFANYANARKTQGFGTGILGNREEEPRHVFTSISSPAASSPQPQTFEQQPLRYVGNSTYSRLSGHQGIPSYASVVSEKAHSHHESESGMEEIVVQARNAIQGRTLILVDGKGDSNICEVLQKKLGGNITFAGEEQIASEMKIAQIVHPGNVAVVLMIEGSVPTANRNVENYCRHFDKPLLRIDRELEITSIARQIVAAMTLWR